MKNIESLYNEKSTICVLAQNDYACAILEHFTDTEIRIMFYDADCKYINDWVLDDFDYSELIKILTDAFSKNTIEATIKFFSDNEPERKLIYITTFKDYLDLKEEYAEECYNRFGQWFLMYDC